MHERSLVNALLRQVEHVSARHPGSRVQSILVRIGEFSGVEPELLVSAYSDLVIDTPYCRATLEVERVALEGVCPQCNRRFRIERFNFQCDRCGSRKINIHGGEEMLLDSVTLEETQP